MVAGDLPLTNGRILAGLARLATFQHGDGLFSIWCGGQPGADITARVAHRLLGLRGLPYDDSEAMLGRARDALLRAGHRDNALLRLDPRFGHEMRSAADAVAYYFAQGDRRDAALGLLQRSVTRTNGTAHWPAGSAWGGELEVTADAARAMYDAGDDLFIPAFNFVAGKLVNGMLYSTADTRALVELLASLRFAATQHALIDGQDVALGDVTIGREVTALSDNLLVRCDEEIEIDHLAPRAGFRFSVRPSATELPVGRRVQIVITPQESTIAPLARLFLPGNLALLKGGANAQTAYLPIEQSSLTVDAVAVRPGRGKLYVSVHDMYDAGKIGTAPGIEIVVRAGAH